MLLLLCDLGIFLNAPTIWTLLTVGVLNVHLESSLEHFHIERIIWPIDPIYSLFNMPIEYLKEYLR